MKVRILHIAVHSGWQNRQQGGSGINAGDTALNPLIQRLFCQLNNNLEFTSRQVWEVVSDNDIVRWRLWDTGGSTKNISFITNKLFGSF